LRRFGDRPVNTGKMVMVDIVDMDKFIEKYKRESNDGYDLSQEEAGPDNG
jgi:hypothetical protein